MGMLRHPAKRLIAIIVELALKSLASSICIALVLKHVNNAPHRFPIRLPIFTCIEPN